MTRALQAGGTFDTARLLDPAAGLAAYRSAVALRPVGTETVALDAAFGRILALDAVARAPVPADARSTMDGFAVRSSDGRAARPIAGVVRMGAPPPPLAPGVALRIPTGGVLPPGADAVVPIEDAEERDGAMRPADVPPPGQYVTPAGDDMRSGDVVLRAGRRIGAGELSVLATLGVVAVPVYRRPRVAVISTGDELIDAAASPAQGQVRDSNRWAVAGVLAGLGCEPLHLERARDEEGAVRERIAAGLAAADAVILTGGSSVGARDVVPAAIDALGGPGVVVHGLRVKPGKPTVLAAVGSTPVIGLPGNPASALTICDAIAAPLLAALTGETAPRRSTVTGTVLAPIDGRPGWTWYVPAVLDGDGLRPLPLRSAHTSLAARADGYVVVGPQRATLAVGETAVLVRYGAWS